MDVAVFSSKPHDEQFLREANVSGRHRLSFFEERLHADAVRLAHGYSAVCVFVNDQLNREVLEELSQNGTRMIALRSAGFNNVDLAAAEELGFTVARVPAYSPHAVAEHTVALLLCLARKLHRAYNRTREWNFSLERMLGFNLQGRTAGVVGTGKIGSLVAELLHAFGCRVLAFDKYPREELQSLGVQYVELDELIAQADVVSLHCPLTPETNRLIRRESVEKMKDGVVLINTSRGALVDTEAVIDGLKSGKIGGVGLDVYEEEADIFFEDLSDRMVQDDMLARIMMFPNVVVTGHQAFFTIEAMRAIAETTIANLSAFESEETPPGLLSPEHVVEK